MIKFALRGMLLRKLRTFLTATGIVLGVGMVTGTLMLTDSIERSIDQIFNDSYQGVDAVISAKSAVEVNFDTAPPDVTFDESVLGAVRALPEVGKAVGSVSDDTSVLLIGQDGKVLAPWSIAASLDPTAEQFNPLKLRSGNWPGAGEVVIDTDSARKWKIRVGDTVSVQGHGALERMKVAGTVSFGDVSSIFGAALLGFDLPTAQRVMGKVGKLNEIVIAKSSDATLEQMRAAVERLLPSGTQLIDPEAQAAANEAAGPGDFPTYIRNFLLVFAGVALFVGAFVIANALTITVAQRTREFATLRTLGASRRQVLSAVVVEALVMGVLASAAGIALGFALAKGLIKLMEGAFGGAPPTSGLELTTRTVVAAVVVGVLVTVLASLRPALRATKVPPIAAVREGSTPPASRWAKFRIPSAAVLATVGVGMIGTGLFKGGLSTSNLLILLLVGVLVLFIGVALLADLLITPLAAAAHPIARGALVVFTVLAWPLFLVPFYGLRRAFWGPGPAWTRAVGALGALNPLVLLAVVLMAVRKLFGRWRPDWPAEFPTVLAERSSVGLAKDNARRDPRRTASTAAALMIGLALVSMVATMAAGIVEPFKRAVDSIFTADYAVTAQDNFSWFPSTVDKAVATAPGATAVTGVRTGGAQYLDKSRGLTAVDRSAEATLHLDWVEGSQAVLSSLGQDGAFVDKGFAKDKNLSVGSPVELLFDTGRKVTVTVRGIFEPPSGGSPFSSLTVSNELFDEYVERPLNQYLFVKMDGGVTEQNTAALAASLRAFPNNKVVTKKEFIDNQVQDIASLLNVFYVLLGLSVIISLFGILNTLALSVFERTREIGMLRAIGATRRQVKRMIRHESVVIALIGAALGIPLGMLLAAMLAARLDFIEFLVPVGPVIQFSIAAIVVGIVAAVFPTRRAARLDPLEALHYE